MSVTLDDLNALTFGRDEIADKIRAEIMNGTLRFGQKISENQYSRKFNVSRTPVREAIVSLASLGLVSVRPKSGTYVVSFTRDSLVEMFDIRLLLETGGVKLASADQRRHLVTKLTNLMPYLEKEVAAPEDFVAFHDVDTAFHHYLVASAGNERLIQMYRPIEVCAEAARSRLEKTEEVVDIANAHHAAVIEALAANNLKEFEEVLKEHLSWVVGMLVRIDELFAD